MDKEWYEGQRHFEEKIVVTKNGFELRIKILPAGWVYVLKKWIEYRQTALKYCKHSKRRARIEKGIKTAERVLAVVIERRIDVNEALKSIKGAE